MRSFFIPIFARGSGPAPGTEKHRTMDYSQTLSYLYESLPMFQRVGGSAYKADLENTRRLDDYFGHPHRRFATLHVAGTNGKGSCSHMLASVLQAAGYRTGLYTSPHLVDFRERVRVDGREVARETVVRFVEEHRDFLERIKPSFFEMTVALAFDHFAREEVDIAVVEVGMGGRLDSTNIITPRVSVITNIGLDHTRFLGNTLEEIAGEKAGIIKEGVPVVIGETRAETAPVFRARAEALHAPVRFADREYRIASDRRENGRRIFGIESLRDGKRLEAAIDLLGDYQRKNILTVLTALDELRAAGFSLDGGAVERGLLCTSQRTGLKGRWQVLGQAPLTVCDTGHNAHGFRQLVSQIAATPHERLYAVLGFVEDKDVDSVLELLPREAHYLFTRASLPRALDENLLREKARAHGLKGEAVPAVADAYRKARALAGERDMIYVGGSTFVVAELLETLPD